ncbi:hypothetical protein LP419_22135 [Massilia sp. H-1]|nr:hypothetical protein LP419_22135 [Massilia sp. H-1]
MTTDSTSNDLIELRADPVTRDIIDVADGIERLMGNRDLYARMLRRFRREYQDATLPILHRHRGPGQAHRAPPGALAQGRPCMHDRRAPPATARIPA